MLILLISFLGFSKGRYWNMSLKFRAMKKFLAVLAVVVSSVVFGQNQTGLDPGTSS